MIYSILDNNGNVINTILASEDFVAANYPGHYALVGPEPIPPEPPPIITKTSMLARFTDQEFAGILAAAKNDVEVEGWKYRFDSASEIDLSSDRVKAGFALLVSKSLLTQARADAILADPVQPGERP